MKIGVLAIILSLILSEILLKLNPFIGFISYLILVSSVFLVLSFENLEKKEDYFFIFLLIVPIVRIVSLFLNFDEDWDFFVQYYIFTGLILFYAWVAKLKINWNGSYLVGFLALILGGLLGVLGLIFDYGIKEILPSFILFVIIEEIYFRNMIQDFLRNFSFFEILVPALIYCAFNITNGLFFASFSFFVGIVGGLIYSVDRSLMQVVLMRIGLLAVLLFNFV